MEAKQDNPLNALDAMGLRVLEAMLTSPEASNHQIAQALGVSHNTTKASYHYIRNELLAVQLRPRPALLDCLTIRFVRASLRNHTEESAASFMRDLEKIPYIQEYYRIEGETDIIFKIVAPSYKILNDTMSKLYASKHAKPVRISHSVMNEYHTDNHELSYLFIKTNEDVSEST